MCMVRSVCLNAILFLVFINIISYIRDTLYIVHYNVYINDFIMFYTY